MSTSALMFEKYIVREPNRRQARRLPPRRATQVTCFASDTSGPDLLLSVLDLSQTGIRMVLKNRPVPGDILHLTLETALLPQPLTMKAETMWSLPISDGRYCVGARFLQALTCAEVEALAYSYAGAAWLFPSSAQPAAASAKEEPAS